MGRVNSTQNVRQAQDYQLDAVRNESPGQTSSARAAPRREASPQLAALTRPPSRTSLREGDTYRTIGMLKTSGYDADRLAASGPVPVPYLSAVERARYQVSIANGILSQKGESGAWQPMNTEGMGYMFVMDGKGKLYAGDECVLQHHSSFLAGAPVAAAGVMEVASGRLRYITDQSGHYSPTTDHTNQLLQLLQHRGVDLSKVQIDRVGLSKSQWASQGVAFERVYPEGTRRKPY